MTTTSGLRVMLYDDTCRGRGALPGLTHSWIAGAWETTAGRTTA